ncbi:ubiquitin-conjugating enzyme E2 Q1-like isoform X1 [Pomacea canaliculata]|uniref:ubiquitin-conjugating enzyme E2 Q1-like isoform X1 n=1 Tax=Pomacea canaliculata TaxID=400727 RepID=UPI000D73B069|nr:ubiquitin-conjugating enzyme E2 Q1-like isoform X1 [Pomacea canaliculata]
MLLVVIMDFMSRKNEAEQWLCETRSKFLLTSVDEKENMMHFSDPNTAVTFNVICPSVGVSWSVCSENEKVLHQLQDVMEYLEARKDLTMRNVLQLINDCLEKATSKKIFNKVSAEVKTESGEGESAGAGKNWSEDDEDDENIDMDYYGDDPDAAAESDSSTKEQEEEDDTTTLFSCSKASQMAVQRLTRDLRNILQQGDRYGFTAGPKGNNLFKWHVELHGIPEDTKLGRDLTVYAARYKTNPAIVLEMQFPEDYPYSPPFLRVITPRFRFLTGGSICMEMLTKSGWRPTNDIESILVQVRCEILSDPNASLDMTQANRPYTERDAREAFDRMVVRYGWNK